MNRLNLELLKFTVKEKTPEMTDVFLIIKICVFPNSQLEWNRVPD